MTVNDDGSVTYTLRRLEVTLRPMTDAQLNRRFAAYSEGGADAVNPYTFGDWTEPGDKWTPPRFTVFSLSVSNYEFPKVRLNPEIARLSTANNREYFGLTVPQFDEYFRSYWLARTGRGRTDFRSRTDLLLQTLFKDEVIFSGQEKIGFLVFPVLHDDVNDITVHLQDLIIRFNAFDLPVETVDLSYQFKREVFRGFQPPAELVVQK